MNVDKLTRRVFQAAALAGGVLVCRTGAAKDDPLFGPGASLRGRPVFPADNPWNEDVSKSPVDPRSAAILRRIGLEKPLHPDFGTVYQGNPNGIPYVVVPGTQ